MGLCSELCWAPGPVVLRFSLKREGSSLWRLDEEGIDNSGKGSPGSSCKINEPVAVGHTLTYNRVATHFKWLNFKLKLQNYVFVKRMKYASCYLWYQSCLNLPCLFPNCCCFLPLRSLFLLSLMPTHCPKKPHNTWCHYQFLKFPTRYNAVRPSIVVKRESSKCVATVTSKQLTSQVLWGLRTELWWSGDTGQHPRGPLLWSPLSRTDPHFLEWQGVAVINCHALCNCFSPLFSFLFCLSFPRLACL